MPGKLTIRDIAQLAGVSTATVSRVLNHKPDVDPLTRERVLRLIEEQGFVPDLFAAQLGSRPSPRNRPFLASFPADFLWGAATSAFQIEGATHEDGRTDSIWDSFADSKSTTFRGQTAEMTADHYHHMQTDFALMAELNLNAYRFSLSWSRILPQGTGRVNARGIPCRCAAEQQPGQSGRCQREQKYGKVEREIGFGGKDVTVLANSDNFTGVFELAQNRVNFDPLPAF